MDDEAPHVIYTERIDMGKKKKKKRKFISFYAFKLHKHDKHAQVNVRVPRFKQLWKLEVVCSFEDVMFD